LTRSSGSLQVPETQQEAEGSKTSHQRGLKKGETGKGTAPCLASTGFNPANNKSIIDLQNEASQKKSGKWKALAPLSNDDDDEAGSSVGDPAQIDVDIDMEDEEKEPGSSSNTNIVPMLPSEGIAALREKLHA
jgi:hypothetical protein